MSNAGTSFRYTGIDTSDLVAKLIKLNSNSLTEVPTLEWLENAEADTLKLLLFIRLTRNSALPIHRLPNEILAEIFTLAADRQSRSGDPSWISLTHVCHLWREVALQHSALWRVINCRNLERAEVFLQRSKGSMLVVQVISRGALYPPWHIAKFVDFLRMVPDRIVGLKITLDPKSIAEVTTLLSFPLPNVNSLHISSTRSRSGSHLPTISLGIFDGQRGPDESPSLRELRSDHVGIPLDPLLYRNLRSLTLHGPRFRTPISNPTMDVFLDILDACTGHLEVIDLEGYGPSLDNREDPYPDPTRFVTLPALRLFSMTSNATPEDIPHLLAHLILPETVRIRLCTENMDEHFSALPRVKTGLKSLGIINELTFDFRSSNNGLNIYGRSSQFSPPDLYLYISMEWDRWQDDSSALAINSFDALKSTFSPSVTSFKFYYSGDKQEILATHWAQFFSHFSNLEELDLSSRRPFSLTSTNTTLPILSALQMPDSSAMESVSSVVSGPTPSVPLLCHKLRELSIGSTRRLEDRTSFTNTGRKRGWQLYDCLRTRLNHSIPAANLEELTLRGPGPGWNDEMLLDDVGTEWPAIGELVDKIKTEEVYNNSDGSELSS